MMEGTKSSLADDFPRARSSLADDFPYKKYSIEDPIELFKNAQRYDPMITSRAPLTVLRGMTTRTPWSSFKQHFPIDFRVIGRNPQTLVIKSQKWAYNAINVLPDYYTEYARVRDLGAYQQISPYEYWQRNKEEIRKELGSSVTRHEERELLYRKFPTEARQGKITNYLGLFKFFHAKRVLDPSAAWGDRMIAALASPTVTHYVGFDPHSKLPPGWNHLLRDLIPVSGKDPSNFIFVNKPFEPQDQQVPMNGTYDMVIVSQPPFIGDVYDAGNPDQAREKYKTFKEYVNGFLSPYLHKAIMALKDEGYLCFTVLDRTEYQITELQLAMVELESMYMHYMGVIYWEGDSGVLIPWWIFQRRLKRETSTYRRNEALQIRLQYDLSLGSEDESTHQQV